MIDMFPGQKRESRFWLHNSQESSPHAHSNNVLEESPHYKQFKHAQGVKPPFPQGSRFV